jgi:hypothetical protein
VVQTFCIFVLKEKKIRNLFHAWRYKKVIEKKKLRLRNSHPFSLKKNVY